MQVLGSEPLDSVVPAKWPDCQPNSRIAHVVLCLIPVVCSELSVIGDNENGVEQNEDVMRGTPRRDMAIDREDSN